MRDLRIPRHAVQPGHHQVSEGAGESPVEQVASRVLFPGLVKPPRFLHHPREFFDEKGHTTGPLVDLINQLLWQRARGALPQQLSDLAPCQAVQCETGLVCDGGPGCLEFGTECEHREDPVVQAFREELAEELQSGRIHPVQVLNDEKDRFPYRARANILA